jgi:hypothetical protein
MVMQGSFYRDIATRMHDHGILERSAVTMGAVIKDPEGEKMNDKEKGFSFLYTGEGAYQYGINSCLFEWINHCLVRNTSLLTSVTEWYDAFRYGEHEKVPLYGRQWIGTKALYVLSMRKEILSLTDSQLLHLVNMFTESLSEGVNYITLDPLNTDSKPAHWRMQTMEKDDNDPDEIAATNKYIDTDNDKREKLGFHVRYYIQSRRVSASFIRSLLACVKTQTLSGDKDMEYRAWRDLLSSLVKDGGGVELQGWLDAYLLKSSQIELGPSDPSENSNSADEEYARMVKGAAVNSSMDVVWRPLDEDTHSKIDDDSFNSVMWGYLQGYVKRLLEKETMEDMVADPSRRQLAQLVRKVKDQMKHVWNDALNFGISKEVFMVEVEVFQRLRQDGLLSNALLVGNAIRFMRRDADVRYQFAATVGKRLLTERLIARGRTSIVEHHRYVI